MESSRQFKNLKDLINNEIPLNTIIKRRGQTKIELEKLPESAKPVTVYAPSWVEKELEEINKILFAKKDKLVFTLCSTYSQNPYQLGEATVTFTNPLSLADLIIISRNESSNTTGRINYNLYAGLGVSNDVIHAIKDLAKQCVIVGEETITHIGGFGGIPFKKLQSPQKVYLCDLSGIQFQQPYNTGRLFLTPYDSDDKGEKQEETIEENTFDHRVRARFASNKAEKIRVKRGAESTQYFHLDLDAYANMVKQDFLLALYALNQTAGENEPIEFSFSKYGTGYFLRPLMLADDKYSDNLSLMIEGAILDGVERAMEEYASTKIPKNKIKRINLPFYGKDSKENNELVGENINKIERIRRKADKLGITVEADRRDSLEKRTLNNNIVMACTNCADPHAATGNEMRYESVDAAMAENLERKANDFNLLLNRNVTVNYVDTKNGTIRPGATSKKVINQNVLKIVTLRTDFVSNIEYFKLDTIFNAKLNSKILSDQIFCANIFFNLAMVEVNQVISTFKQLSVQDFHKNSPAQLDAHNKLVDVYRKLQSLHKVYQDNPALNAGRQFESIGSILSSIHQYFEFINKTDDTEEMGKYCLETFILIIDIQVYTALYSNLDAKVFEKMASTSSTSKANAFQARQPMLIPVKVEERMSAKKQAKSILDKALSYCEHGYQDIRIPYFTNDKHVQAIEKSHDKKLKISGNDNQSAVMREIQHLLKEEKYNKLQVSIIPISPSNTKALDECFAINVDCLVMGLQNHAIYKPHAPYSVPHQNEFLQAKLRALEIRHSGQWEAEFAKLQCSHELEALFKVYNDKTLESEHDIRQYVLMFDMMTILNNSKPEEVIQVLCRNLDLHTTYLINDETTQSKDPETVAKPIQFNAASSDTIELVQLYRGELRDRKASNLDVTESNNQDEQSDNDNKEEQSDEEKSDTQSDTEQSEKKPLLSDDAEKSLIIFEYKLKHQLQEIEKYLATRKAETRTWFSGILGYSEEDYRRRQDHFNAVEQEVRIALRTLEADSFNDHHLSQDLLSINRSIEKNITFFQKSNGSSNRYYDLMIKLKGTLFENPARITDTKLEDDFYYALEAYTQNSIFPRTMRDIVSLLLDRSGNASIDEKEKIKNEIIYHKKYKTLQPYLIHRLGNDQYQKLKNITAQSARKQFNNEKKGFLEALQSVLTIEIGMRLSEHFKALCDVLFEFNNNIYNKIDLDNREDKEIEKLFGEVYKVLRNATNKHPKFRDEQLDKFYMQYFAEAEKYDFDNSAKRHFEKAVHETVSTKMHYHR